MKLASFLIIRKQFNFIVKLNESSIASHIGIIHINVNMSKSSYMDNVLLYNIEKNIILNKI